MNQTTQITAMHIIRNLDTGGAQEVVRTLAASLPAAGCRVVVCTFKDGALRPAIERLGVPVEVLPDRRASVLNLPGFLLDMLRIRRALIALVARYNVGVVQTHLLRVLDFLVLSLRLRFPQIRVFWTIHNYNFALRRDQLKRQRWLLRPKQWSYRLLYRLGARWIDGFIAVSPEVAPAIVATIGPVQDKIHVISNGVEVERYTQPVDRGAIRRQLGLPDSTRLLIVVGTLKTQKGHRYLLEALPPVLAQYPDLHALIVGDGDLRQELERQVQTLGLNRRVHFLGNRSDVPQLLAASDLFVLPSLWEGLPMALIEAMASGLPVIATNVSGAQQVMQPNETGLLVAPRHVEQLRAAISRLVSDPALAREMGAAARQRVIAEFSARNQAQQHHALYAQAGNSASSASQERDLPRPLLLTYIIGTYPSLTTTFIDREILALRDSGAKVQILSIRRPGGLLSAEQQALQQGVTYLLPVRWLLLIMAHLWWAVRQPLAYFGTLGYLLTRPHRRLRARFKTLLHFAEGGYAAFLLRDRPGAQIHAHFVDRAATIALVASRLLNVPYSVTAHANDIYIDPVLLPEKLAGARFVVTCTGYNQQHLAAVASGAYSHKVSCLYHGLDIRIFRPNGQIATPRPIVLAVGQLKEKKGLAYLIDSCHMLKQRGYEFECRIVGEGPLRPDLEAQIRRLSLGDTVTLCGALPQQQVIAQYQQASIFVLPCVLSANGDRDGIPNALLEAMAMQLPVVSTRLSGIPEAVKDGVNGLLVPPADAEALAESLALLLDDPDLRRKLGRQGRQTVVEHFDIERNAGRLLAAFSAGSVAATHLKDEPVCQ